MRLTSRALTVAVAPALLYLSGCASTAPTASFTREIAAEARVAAADDATVSIQAAPEIKIDQSEKARFAETLQKKVADLKAKNTRNGEKKTYEVEVLLTRYEKGNAFARAMLAGLGQMHIEGNVKLLELPERKVAGEFSMKKTFAWGGFYGAATGIEAIESAFADGVAAALTGQAAQAEAKNP